MSSPENPPIREEPRTEQAQTATNTENRSDQAAPPKARRHELRDWLMLGATVALVVVTIRYVQVATQQRDAMLGQTSAMIAQREVMDRQLGKMQQQVDEMRTQSGTFDKTLNETRRGADAAVLSANAAQQTTGITKESFLLLERPALGIEAIGAPFLEVGKRATVQIRVKNFGHLPAINTTTLASAFAYPVTDINAPCPEPNPITEVVGMESRSLISVGGYRDATAISKALVTADDLRLINDDKRFWIFAHLVVKYGNAQQYFFEYYGRHNVATSSWEECGTHNRAN